MVKPLFQIICGFWVFKWEHAREKGDLNVSTNVLEE